MCGFSFVESEKKKPKNVAEQIENDNTVLSSRIKYGPQKYNVVFFFLRIRFNTVEMESNDLVAARKRSFSKCY